MVCGQVLILMNEWTERWKQCLANYLKVVIIIQSPQLT